MKRVLLLAICAIMIISCGSQKQLVRRKKLKTGSMETYNFVGSEYPPFSYVNMNGEYDGFDIQLIKALAKEEEFNASFQLYNWDEAVETAKNGNTDAIFSLYANEERKKFLKYPTVNNYIDRNLILATPSFKGDIAEISDLKRHTIGMVSGFSYSTEFDQFKDCRKIETDSQEALISKFIRGEFDLIIISNHTGWYLLEEMKMQLEDQQSSKNSSLTEKKIEKIDKIRALSYESNVEPSYIAVSRKSKRSEKLYKKLNNALLKLQENGKLLELKRKYLNIK